MEAGKEKEKEDKRERRRKMGNRGESGWKRE